MQMEAFLWLFLPVFVAGGSALLSYFVMQARMEVALAKERESLAEARAKISSYQVTLDERVKAILATFRPLPMWRRRSATICAARRICPSCLV